jgi:hypothetical protein
MAGSILNCGSFQVNFPTKEVAKAIEPPGSIPPENPQISSCIIRALKGNTGTIYVGDSTVTNTTGFELAAGDSLNLDIMGLGKAYGWASKENDKIAVFWVGP